MLPLPITELDVQALVDSHLSWEEEKQVIEALRADIALKNYHAQIVAQKKLLVSWWLSREEEDKRKASFH